MSRFTQSYGEERPLAGRVYRPPAIYFDTDGWAARVANQAAAAVHQSHIQYASLEALEKKYEHILQKPRTGERRRPVTSGAERENIKNLMKDGSPADFGLDYASLKQVLKETAAERTKSMQK